MKIYLDTSVLSALFDARNPERQELTKEFFSRIDEHEVFISELTRVEIEETPDEELRDKMRRVIADFSRAALSGSGGTAIRRIHQPGGRIREIP